MTKQFYYDHGWGHFPNNRVMVYRFINGHVDPEIRIIHSALLEKKTAALIDSLMEATEEEIAEETHEIIKAQRLISR